MGGEKDQNSQVALSKYAMYIFSLSSASILDWKCILLILAYMIFRSCPQFVLWSCDKEMIKLETNKQMGKTGLKEYGIQLTINTHWTEYKF